MKKFNLERFSKVSAAFSGVILGSSFAMASLVPAQADIDALKADLITAGTALMGVILAVYSVKVIIGLFSK